VGRACWWLVPLHELVLSTVLNSPKVFADDTTLLDPGRGRTKPALAKAGDRTTVVLRGRQPAPAFARAGSGVGRDFRPLRMSIARTVRACPGEGRG
jgi:hypothetical protein